MLPSCKQVAEQASENIDEPLTGSRWLKQKIHLLMCGYCRRYSKQITLSSQVVNHLSGHDQEEDNIKKKVAQRFHQLHGKGDQAN